MIRRLAWSLWQLLIGYVTILALTGMVIPPGEQIVIVVGAAFLASCALALLMALIASAWRALFGEQPVTTRGEPRLDF